MASLKSQAVKLEMSLKTFNVNMDFMRDEVEDEMAKVILAGAAAYATSAQKHTPPALGKTDIPEEYYQSIEMDRTLNKGEKTGGKRVIYNLRNCVRNHDSRRFKKMFGKLLRDGYEYVVVMKNRRGQGSYMKPCRTLAEAQRYAVEDYRGLLRASWGMSFQDIGLKPPPAFRKYTTRRPEILKRKSFNKTKFEKNIMTATLTNEVVPNDAPYMQTADINASIAAVKRMDQLMTKYFQKKFNI